MRIRRRGAVLVLAGFLAACGRGRDTKAAAPSGGDATPQASNTQADEPETPGRALYVRACVMCHGERGAGTQIGGALNDRPRSVDEVVKAINEGVPQANFPHTIMPARGDGTFTDQDIRAVAEYVHSLAR
jgi:mono/diheme cytochrome c family protein